MMSARAPYELRLDAFVPADAAVLCEVDRDPEHRRRFEFPEDFVPSMEHAAGVIARWEEERRAGVRYPFAVREVGSDALVGGCELQPAEEGTARLSYWTHPDYRRRGFASEAVRQVCALAFAELGFRRIEMEADSDNVPSRRVAVRNGFREAGEGDTRVQYVLEDRE